jgi:hypothetical protein
MADAISTANEAREAESYIYLSRTKTCWDMVAGIYRDHSYSYHNYHTASLKKTEVVCGFSSLL